MTRSAMALAMTTLLTSVPTSLCAPILIVEDPDGAAARIGAPVSVEVDLARVLETTAQPNSLRLVEQGDRPGMSRTPVAVQFVQDARGSKRGRLWWLMPPGTDDQRQFALVVSDEPLTPTVVARLDKQRQAVLVRDGHLPVLRYNQGTVPPPAEIVEHFEKKRKPPFYYARGDYIHPLFGPDAKPLTDDYSINHPHHRGICWAWPIVRWRNEARDLWAVRVLPDEPGGVWARPVAIHRTESGPVLAEIDAENVWKWGDKDPIVREQVIIRAFRHRDRRRFLDIELRLTALVDDVRIGGRPRATYGGFNLRTFPEFEGRRIDMHIDAPEAKPRRAWFHLTGEFPDGNGMAGVALFEHVTNPDYPSFPNPRTADAVPGRYPRWRTMQPAWPGDREVPLSRDRALVLKYRLWIHPGTSDQATLSNVWTTYADPPTVRLEKRTDR